MAVRVGRRHQDEELEALAVAAQLQHAFGPEDVGPQGHGHLLVELGGGTVVEDRIHVLDEAVAVRVGEAEVVASQVAQDRRYLVLELGVALAQQVEYLCAGNGRMPVFVEQRKFYVCTCNIDIILLYFRRFRQMKADYLFKSVPTSSSIMF